MTAVPNPSAARSLRTSLTRRPGLVVLVVLYLLAASCARTPAAVVAAAVVLVFLLARAAYSLRHSRR